MGGRIAAPRLAEVLETSMMTSVNSPDFSLRAVFRQNALHACWAALRTTATMLTLMTCAKPSVPLPDLSRVPFEVSAERATGVPAAVPRRPTHRLAAIVPSVRPEVVKIWRADANWH